MNEKKCLAMFPGQGSQYVGMGRQLLTEFPYTARLFEEAEDAANASIRRLCLEGPEDQLKRTENTQPCLVTVSIATWTVLQKEIGFIADLFAGHSLGEFSALVAVDLETTTDGQRGTPISTKAVSVDPRLGVELGYKNLVFLRGGVGNYQKIQDFAANSSGIYNSSWKGQYSLGVGVAVSGLRIDLALSRLAVEKLGSSSQTNSLIVSLGYAFK